MGGSCHSLQLFDGSCGDRTVKKKVGGGNDEGCLKQTEVKDDFRSGPCVFRVINLSVEFNVSSFL